MGRYPLPRPLTMSREPERPTRGQPVFPWAVKIWEAIRRQRVIAGPGIVLRESSSGTVISAVRPPGKSAATPPAPLTLLSGSAPGFYRIAPGYVNFEMPTLGGTALDDADPPEIEVTADVWVWVKCVGTFGVGGDDTYVVTIVTSATEDMPAGAGISATGFTSYRPIGSVDFTAGTPATYAVTNTHAGGNLGVNSFGNVNLWWRA